MGYTTYQAVETYMGITFNNSQRAQATGAIEAASVWIDRYTGRSWAAASAVTDEICSLLPQQTGGLRAYTKYRPITSISAVKTRAIYADATISTLATTEWELFDGSAGLVLINGWVATNSVALISYTHTATTAPLDVQTACQMITAAWMAPSIHPDSVGVHQISVGQNDLSVTYAADAHQVPPEALEILNQYRRVVIA